jgi:hypothetical protein
MQCQYPAAAERCSLAKESMFRRCFCNSFAGLVVALACTATACGACAGDGESLDAPACCHELARAGHPHHVAPWAIPSNTCAYSGYYVGGGAHSYSGPGRCADQGTWGWDFVGRCVVPLVRLGWSHPPREQGGTGSYEPDGPKVRNLLQHK